MPPGAVEHQEWLSLVHATNVLVSQDRHGYPKVQRDLTGLLQSSQSARARTSRVRSAEEAAAATRLLALQGFDAGRCVCCACVLVCARVC
jgi:nuclear pore complex protein Nup93